jgi:hypothetical protein
MVSFAFTMTVMCIEPRYPSTRIFLFPGLAIVLGMFHASRADLAGRSLLVWNLTTALNTLVYSAFLYVVFRIFRRFSSGAPPGPPQP